MEEIFNFLKGFVVLLVGAGLFGLMIYYFHQYALEVGKDFRRYWRK